MQVSSSSGSFSHPSFLADDTPGGEGLSSPPSVYVWGWGGVAGAPLEVSGSALPLFILGGRSLHFQEVALEHG